MRNLTTILALLILLLPTVSHAQDDWAVVKAVPPGTLLRINSSITGRLDAVDDTQITLSGRRLIQDVVGRVERVGVGGKRKRNGWIGVLGGAVFGATAMRVNGGNALGMAWC